MSMTKRILMHRNGKDQYGSHRDDDHTQVSPKKAKRGLAASAKTAMKIGTAASAKRAVIQAQLTPPQVEVLCLRQIVDGLDGYFYEDVSARRWAVTVTWCKGPEYRKPPTGMKRGTYYFGAYVTKSEAKRAADGVRTNIKLGGQPYLWLLKQWTPRT
jgi:hypothetical protein